MRSTGKRLHAVSTELFENSPTVTFIIDRDATVVWGNAACRLLFGDQLLAPESPIYSAIDTRHVRGMLQVDNAVGQLTVLLPDLHQVYTLAAYVLANSDLAVATLSVFASEFAEDLGEPELFHISDGHFVPHGLEGRVEQISGYRAEEWLTGRIQWLDLVVPQDRHAYQSLQQHCESKRASRLLYRLVDRRGQTHLLWQETFRHFYPADQLIYYSSIWDISAYPLLFGSGRDAVLDPQLPATLPEGVLKGSLDGILLFANQQAAELFGYSDPQELLHCGKNIYDLAVGEDYQRANSDAGETLKKGRFLNRNYRAIKKNGQVFDCQVHAASRLDLDGQVLTVIGLLRNSDFCRQERSRFIEQALHLRQQVQRQTAELQESRNQLQREAQKRQEAEGLLRKNAEIHRLIIESTQEMIVILDDQGRLLFVNPAAARQLETSLPDCLGRSLGNFLPAEMAANFTAKIKTVLDQGQVRTFQHKVTWPGRESWFSITAQPLSDSENGAKQMMFVAMDITAEKRQQEELEVYRHQLEDLVVDRTRELIKINQRLKSEIRDRMKIESQLRQSQAKYQMLVENQTDLVVRLDWEGRIHFVSPSVCDFFGRTEAELLGQEALLPVTENERESITKLWHKLEKPPHRTRFEHRINTRLGLRWLQWEVQGILGAQGQMSAIIGTGRDVTEKNEVEQQLRRSEARIREVIERSPDCYFFFDKDGCVRNVNRAMCKLAGLSRDQLIGTHFNDFILPAFKDTANRLYGQVKAGKNLNWEEMELRRPTGGTVWVGFSERRVMDRGEFIGIEGFLRDITAIREARQQIDQERARYLALFSNIPDEVVSLNADGRISEANPTFIAHWGDAIGQKPRDCLADSKFVEILERCFAQAIESKQVVSQNFTIERSGRRVYYSLSMKAVCTEKGAVIGAVAMNADITELEEALERSRLLANRLIKVQEEERGRISRELHDTIIQHLSALQMKLRTAETVLLEEPKHASELLKRSVERLTQLIVLSRNISYLLRPPLLDDFGLAVALKNYMLQVGRQSNIKITCRCDVEMDRPEAELATAIFRIAQEALTNIQKHSYSNRAWVKLWQDGDDLYLLVRDFGCGFDLQKNGAGSQGDQLGLLGIQERVELLGGRFSLQSWLNRGTRIFVQLPLRGQAGDRSASIGQ